MPVLLLVLPEVLLLLLLLLLLLVGPVGLLLRPVTVLLVVLLLVRVLLLVPEVLLVLKLLVLLLRIRVLLLLLLHVPAQRQAGQGARVAQASESVGAQAARVYLMLGMLLLPLCEQLQVQVHCRYGVSAPRPPLHHCGGREATSNHLHGRGRSAGPVAAKPGHPTAVQTVKIARCPARRFMTCELLLKN